MTGQLNEKICMTLPNWENSFITSRYEEKLSISEIQPKGDNAVLLMLPGFTSRKLNATNKQIGERISRLGVRCIAIDPSGHGESDGAIEDQTIIKAANEIEDVVSWLLEDGLPSGTPLGVLGNSFTATAAVVAAGNCKRINCLALKSPVADYARMREAQIGCEAIARWRKNGLTTLPDGTKSRSVFLDDAERVDVYSAISDLECAVLAIHGEKDEQIPKKQRILFQKAMEKGSKEYALISGADHVFSGENYLPSIDLLLGFLVRSLLLDR